MGFTKLILKILKKKPISRANYDKENCESHNFQNHFNYRSIGYFEKSKSSSSSQNQSFGKIH